MVKTNTPDAVLVGGRKIRTNALPDPFDARDLQYLPRLQVLPDRKDQRAGQVVLDQSGQSCTGHAVAALIDTVRSELPPEDETPEHGPPRIAKDPVSPYMLYAMARKYDEYPGTADIGSSLRGALKGWYHHGVCKRADWPTLNTAKDLYDPDFMATCFEVPLGAYYRVNTRRIDDMQSAITELNAIAVSAAIHRGWESPQGQGQGTPDEMWVIQPNADALGGHAFLIAGYNDVGFLIQNSWGLGWGKKGYATLPYEDWLDNAYDAWVGRPGVPQAHVASRRRVVISAGATLAAATGPNISRLKDYVIDVTAGGRMDTKGQITSDPTQIAAAAARMGRDLDTWKAAGFPRHVVIYAHGGLVGESGGIAVADRMIDWWRTNHVYPIHVVWESDALTTIVSFLDHVKEQLPFGGLRDGVFEAVDRAIEGFGRNIGRLWTEMKVNARLASAARRAGQSDAVAPGVTLFLDHLRTYRATNPDLQVHLVAHSAGSVVVAGIVERLVAMGMPVESVQLMGGAISVDEFTRDILSHMPGIPGSNGQVHRFTAYDLQNKFELDDVCPGPPMPAVYHKSLLYFVARSLEPSARMFERPMVGLETGMKNRQPVLGGRSLVEILGEDSLVVAPTHTGPPNARSMAHGHADFDDDEETLTSVLLRILGKPSVEPGLVTAYAKGGMPSSQQTDLGGPGAAA
ncbi:MAG: hypothetical protein ACJ765_05520 [Chloroflexota bacterium]